jgi:farnesyl diphosphate synthase
VTLEAFLAEVRARTGVALERTLPAPDDTRLPCAMRDAVLVGGKRLRAALVHAAGRCCGAAPDMLDAPAVAVELLHAYSLIHDDLPAMDDAPLRRGRPACHVAYGEAMAILAGDALQALAFEALAGAPGLPDATRLRMVAMLARSGGCAGMAGGQARDLALAPERPVTCAHLERISRGKTGALIRASVALGALAAQAPEQTIAALDAYADALGLAFQIRDDVLDVTGAAQATGKAPGVDARHAKPTFAAVLGVERAQALAMQRVRQARAALRDVAGAGLLAGIADLAAARVA